MSLEYDTSNEMNSNYPIETEPLRNCELPLVMERSEYLKAKDLPEDEDFKHCFKGGVLVPLMMLFIFAIVLGFILVIFG